MNKKIRSALISVFYKDGLEPLVKLLSHLGVTIYSTGGTQKFLEQLGLEVIPVERLTSYPSILGGRVKTLHPAVFGGILGRRNVAADTEEMEQYHIPEIDLVVVDLYPFQETLKEVTSGSFTGSNGEAEQRIIDKIDIGGPSMIRGAAKNFRDVTVIASRSDYEILQKLLAEQEGEVTLQQRRQFAATAFDVVKQYDIAISDYFNAGTKKVEEAGVKALRYGENPHQQASFRGNLDEIFSQLHGKELSYNNLVDVDAALQLIREFPIEEGPGHLRTFAIIKHTNVCGIASRPTTSRAWNDALAGDPESAFGGVLITNSLVDKETAEAINEIFFEVLVAPVFENEAVEILKSKKNRILLQMEPHEENSIPPEVILEMHKSLLNGELIQTVDEGNFLEWREEGGRETTIAEKEDLKFANLVCKHLKSNAIALVRNRQLLGKGCGQTSRVDALRQAIEKAGQFKFDLHGATLASDAFFPFDDCVKMAHQAGISAIIQPGGSIRDKDSIEYCRQHNLAMVITGMRHFRH